MTSLSEPISKEVKAHGASQPFRAGFSRAMFLIRIFISLEVCHNAEALFNPFSRTQGCKIGFLGGCFPKFRGAWTRLGFANPRIGSLIGTSCRFTNC
jgi:hypothetical protein